MRRYEVGKGHQVLEDDRCSPVTNPSPPLTRPAPNINYNVGYLTLRSCHSIE
jgi:hypothetical protein